MASLTLKNLPDDLLGALRAAAERDRRSLTQEVIHLLDAALRGRLERGRSARPSEEVEAQLAAWRELAGQWKSDVDPKAEADRLMERRTRGREIDL
jgi:plasmid stability protein